MTGQRAAVSLGKPQELLKEHMGEWPTDDWMECEEDSLILSLYLHFFVAAAQQTNRLNAVAVA